jgi:hypothetical protein
VKFHVIEESTSNRAQSPVRVVEQKTGREVGPMVRILNSAGSPTGSPSSLQNFAPSLNPENRQRLAGKAR